MLSTGISDSSDATFLTADSSENATFAGNLTVTGNLTVSGTQTVVSSSTQTIADPLIELNTGAGSNANDLGFVFERGSTGDNACLIWDESADSFAVGTTTATGTSTGNMTFTAGAFTAGSVIVDELTINADTITATDDFIIDAVGDITLDAADNQIFFKDAGTTVGTLSMTSGDLKFISNVSDQDMIFAGTDGGSEITALTFDMSDAGKATFNNHVVVNDRIVGADDLILVTTDSNEKIHMDSDGYIKFETAGTDRGRFTSGGNLYINQTASSGVRGLDNRVQVSGTDLATSSIALHRYQAGAYGPYLHFAKSRHGTVGSHTIVQDGDVVGSLGFYPSDGSDFVSNCAEIIVQVDGTPGSNDVPGRILFQTAADGAAASSERMRLDASGNLGIGCTAGSRLEVRGAANGTSLAEFSGTDGRGLKLFTQKSNYPTDSGQNDAVVVYNAQDTENAGYPGHVFQYGGNEVLRLQQIESSGATGAVGINNNAPAYTFDITSTGESNSMRIHQADDAKDVYVNFNNAGTGTGDDTLLSMTTVAGAGDPYIRWNIAGTDSWAMGINNSENDEFQLTNQSTLGATRYWTLVGGNLHFSPDDSDCLIYLGSTGGDFGGNSSHSMRCSGNNFMFNSGNSNFIFEIAGSQKGYIDANGFNNGSDRSLKENIKNIQYGLSTVHRLIPRKFKWIKEQVESIGFIAQEVEDVIPELITTSRNGEPGQSVKGMNYGALTSVLVKAIQELDQEVTNRDQTITDLEKRIEAIEQRLI